MSLRVKNIQHVPEGSPRELSRLLAASVADGARSVLVLAGDGVPWPEPEVSPLLRQCPVPVFGGVFPQVVRDTTHSASALVVVGLDAEVDVHAIAGLDRTDTDFAPALGRIPQPDGSVMVLVDGLAVSIARFIESVFDHVGAGQPLVGGGAGSLSFVPRPCLFSPDGLLQGAALLVRLPGSLHVGVDHGWMPVKGPFVVTRTRGNTIEQIDYRPASEVYRNCVEPLVGATLTADNFFAHAKAFPFGMERFDGSLLVRDPIVMQGDALVCVGEVPEQTVVRVLQGHPERLIAAARSGAERAVAGTPGVVRGALLIDCISRVLFLGDRFGEELAAVQGAMARDGTPPPLFGALTLGEIANNGKHCLEFYNKTFVVAAFADD
jgi:hypothetical protein